MVPNNGYYASYVWFRAHIGARFSSNYPAVTLLDISPTVSSLEVGTAAGTYGTGYGLTIGDARTLTLTGQAQIYPSDALINYGAITIGSTNSGTAGLVLGSASNNYNTITLAGSANDTISGTGTLTNSGTMRGGGTISAPVTNTGTVKATNGTLKINNTFTTNSGTIGADTGGTLNAFFADITAAHVSLAGGSLDSTNSKGYTSADLSGFGYVKRPFNNSGGSITASGGTLKFQDFATLTNPGTLNVPTGGTFENALGSAMTFPTVNLTGGTLTGSGGFANTATNFGGYGTLAAALTNSGTITANNATALGITGALTNSGTLNAGTSTVSPTGILAFSGSGSLSNSGTVNVYGTLSNTGSALALTGSGNAYLYGGTLSGAGGFSNANNLAGYGSIDAALTNTGTLTATGAGKTLTVTGAVTGSGDVKVGTTTSGDNATLDLQENLGAHNFTLNEAAILKVASGKIITLNGNFNNYAASASQWQPAAGFNLTMSGSTFEVAGHDYGAVSTGFSNNFNLANLNVTDNLQLLDAVNNGNRGGIHTGTDLIQHEALYVDSLSGSGTLNLNHLWLYVNNGGVPFALADGTFGSLTVSNSPVPIPGSVLLLGSGLLGLAGWRRFRKS